MSRTKLFIVTFTLLALFCDVFTKSTIVPHLRIVGGTEAANGSSPYLVSLRYSTDEHFCGGAIITRCTILTASHCVIGLLAARTSVVVGSNRLNSGGTRYQVSSFRVHPAYDPKILINDVGLVVIDEGMKFGENVQPILIWTESVEDGELVNLSGWGSTNFPDRNTNSLQTIQLQIIPLSRCKNDLDWLNPIIESQICTLTITGEGACFGDSGSPLIYEEKVVGIVSWGKPCAIGYPDVYTKVASFISWIDENKV